MLITENFILVVKLLYRNLQKIADTSDLVKYATLNANVIQTENKISDTNGLVSTTDCNTKITEMKNEIPDVSYLI